MRTVASKHRALLARVLESQGVRESGHSSFRVSLAHPVLSSTISLRWLSPEDSQTCTPNNPCHFAISFVAHRIDVAKRRVPTVSFPFNPFSENIVNISNRLNMHFAAAAVVTVLASSAQAAIVYHGNTPIAPINGINTFIDLHNGAWTGQAGAPGWDLRLGAVGPSFLSLQMSFPGGILTTNNFQGNPTASLLAEGTVIGAQDQYSSGADLQMLLPSSPSGQVAPNSTFMIGYELRQGEAARYFGWARFTVGADFHDGLTLTDWAYESTSNTSIAAGAGAVPAPGALALLGLAGLAGRRRRA